MTTLNPAKPPAHPLLSSPGKTILLTGLTAGTLDLSMAVIVWSFILRKVAPTQIFQGIASGVFGKEAFTGGWMMILCGGIFHYIIAFSFAIAYFLVFPYITFMQRHKVISGLLYGIFAWAWMNYIVLPLSNVNQSPFRWSNALISIAILMVCIGLPISLIVHKYYTGKKSLK
jgi:hypothetical protein